MPQVSVAPVQPQLTAFGQEVRGLHLGHARKSNPASCSP
jgi:hypothetical protein